MGPVPPAVEALADHLSGLRWVRDLLVAGSLALHDYVPGVSDIDLVAVVDGAVDPSRVARLGRVHRGLDRQLAAGANLGCIYVDDRSLLQFEANHPTWTHGRMARRALSGITRAELVRHGFEVLGRSPREVLPPVTADDVRRAARAELLGYWVWATRRPTMWLSPTFADLSLTSMARGRHALRTGQLLTKTRAIERADAPRWLVEHLRARRRGEQVASPLLHTAWIGWQDARRTVRAVHNLPRVN